LNKRAVLCILGAAASLLLGIFLPVFVSFSDDFVSTYLRIGVQELLIFGLPALLLYARNPRAWSQLKEGFIMPAPLPSGLTALAGVSYTLLGGFITTIWSLRLMRYGIPPMQNTMPNPSNIAQYALAFACGALIPAISEELVFRGLLLGALRRKSDRAAVLLSAVAFAALHLNLHALPSLFVFGLLLARLTLRYRGLLLPILFHFVYNLAVIALLATNGAASVDAMALGTFIALASTYFLLRKPKEEPHGTDHTGL
jgi:membrane protease YdiL (CAAX protease family)